MHIAWHRTSSSSSYQKASEKQSAKGIVEFHCFRCCLCDSSLSESCERVLRSENNNKLLEMLRGGWDGNRLYVAKFCHSFFAVWRWIERRGTDKRSAKASIIAENIIERTTSRITDDWINVHHSHYWRDLYDALHSYPHCAHAPPGNSTSNYSKYTQILEPFIFAHSAISTLHFPYIISRFFSLSLFLLLCVVLQK